MLRLVTSTVDVAFFGHDSDAIDSVFGDAVTVDAWSIAKGAGIWTLTLNDVVWQVVGWVEEVCTAYAIDILHGGIAWRWHLPAISGHVGLNCGRHGSRVNFAL